MIKRRIIDNTTIRLDPGSALDNSNAHEMAAAISEAQNEGYSIIVIVMNSLEFLSSAGVGAILGAVEISRGMGGDIVLKDPSEKILHILDVLDLRDYLTIRTSVASA